MNRIVFLMKDGVGFGHIRRTLLVADQIRLMEPSCRITFISQAGSLLLFHSSVFPVINLPDLDRLASNLAESVYWRLLDKLLSELNPTLIVQDTESDDWYLSVPSVRDVPKILILRRLGPLYFDEYRLSGHLAAYDKIILTESRRDFLLNPHVYEAKVLASLNSHLEFTGPVYHQPTASEVAEIRKRYLITSDPVIVVNAGAGGEHVNEEFCQHLFSTILSIANRLHVEGIPAHFILVLGPYHLNPKEAGQNVRIVRFEPLLPALLQVARIAIVRPGYNVIHEALAGAAHVIAIPGVSYLEEQRRWVHLLHDEYGVHIGDYRDTDRLYEMLIRLLRTPSPASRSNVPAPHQSTVARSILKELHDRSENQKLSQFSPPHEVLFVVGNVSAGLLPEATQMLYGICPDICIADNEGSDVSLTYLRDLDSLRNPAKTTEAPVDSPDRDWILLRSSSDIELSLPILMQNGIKVVLYVSGMGFGANSDEWCRHHRPERSGVLEVRLSAFQPDVSWQRHLTYHISRIAQRERFVGVFLDLSGMNSWDMISQFTHQFREWLVATECNIVSLRTFLDHVSFAKLMPKDYEPVVPETQRVL